MRHCIGSGRQNSKRFGQCIGIR